jgi:hypothetical protein
LIYAAKKHNHINGPGCPAKVKPVVTRNYISEIKDREFESFFSDKDNVTMSSYRVDQKTNLPLLYLKDNKKALWQKFEATYPDGITERELLLWRAWQVVVLYIEKIWVGYVIFVMIIATKCLIR